MKYLLLIYTPPRNMADFSPEAGAKMMAEYNAFTTDIKQRGQHLAGEGLKPVNTAKTVRVRNGKAVNTDGPFAETKEQLGGFYMVDVKDLDEALAVAAKIPDAKNGSVEVRPVMDYEMKYLFLIYQAESLMADFTPEMGEKLLNEYMAYGAELKKRGAYIAGEGLKPVATAKTVRVRNGKSVSTDGPFAETKEQLGGFYLVDVKSVEEALELAAMIPDARNGSVEVRPIMDY